MCQQVLSVLGYCLTLLQIRKDTKLENKKAKREKKLLRAGFEGRKQGFIGGSSAPAGGK